MAKSVGARMDAHEIICAERYTGILHRIGRLEKIILWANGSFLACLIASLGFFLAQKLH